jgi:cell division protein FtsI/penicillin-binding protein 2
VGRRSGGWQRLASACLLALAAALSPQRGEARGTDFRRLAIGESSVAAILRDGSVQLTLDPELQRTAERLLVKSRARAGAVVASDVRTGRILAWASRGDGRDLVAYPSAPSASLFKVITAAALLESDRVSLQTRQCYSGGERTILLEDLRLEPARDTTCTAFGDALGHSVNLVFARLAIEHLTPADIQQRAALLGFSGAVPIDVPVGLSKVVIPEDRLGMARAAAGFWNGRLTPLGALFAMQTIANRGERVRLQVLGGADVERISEGRAMRESTAAALQKMLAVTVRSGTASRLFQHADGTRPLARQRVAGKTGTLVGGRPKRMFSWFAGFAPSSGEPEIAVTVLLRNDVEWWEKAAEVARDFLESYFQRERAVARR